MAKYINDTELKYLLIGIKEPTEIELYVDIWTQLKSGNPWNGKIRQRHPLKGIVGFRIGKEAESRKWGTASDNGIVITHNAKNGDIYKYVQMKVDKKPKYEDVQFFDCVKGSRVDKELVLEWKRSMLPEQTNTNSYVRDINMLNILEVKINGKHYIITE